MPIYIELKDDRSEKIRYSSPDYPIYINRALISEYPNHTVPMHWHDEIELIIILSGSLRYHINDRLVDMRAGEGVLVNSRQLHSGLHRGRQDCDFICVLLHPMLLCTLSETERRFVLPIVRNAALPFLFLRPDVPWQGELLSLGRGIYEGRDSRTAPLRLQADFFRLWALLCENLPEEELRPRAESPELSTVKNMVGFIQQHYTRRISLSEIAAAGLVGQSKCCRLFSHYFQTSPMQYLNQYRLNKSVALLQEGERSITEIALQVGFGSASYFTETFHKWMGQTPSEFRAARQGEAM